MITLRGDDGKLFTIDIDEMVICLSSEDTSFYKTGDVFSCVIKGGIFPTNKVYTGEVAPYGGDYGIWQRYYPDEGVEDLL